MLLFFVPSLSAQPLNNEVGDVVPASPNAAAINKYTEVPISYFTGVPNISIPIYQIQDGPIQVPISLSYHASGLKLGEAASWVGLGWNLNYGGMVTRTILGYPDDQVEGRGFIEGRFRDVSTIDAIDQFLDTEADIFHINLGGYSGKMRRTVKSAANGYSDWNLYPYENIRIQEIYNPNRQYEIQGFEFTMPNGLKYSFGINDKNGAIVERSEVSIITPHPDPQKQSNSAWYLTKITSPDGKYFVEYHYVQENYQNEFLSSNESTSFEMKSPTGISCTNNEDTEVYTYRTLIQGKRLSRITTSQSDFSIEFLEGEQRMDITPYLGGLNPPMTLDAIKINQGKDCKLFELTNSYWGESNSYSYEKRLFLDEVQEKDCNDKLSVPPYIFDYGPEVDVPSRLSKQIDHWGYYNGATNNDNLFTLIPFNASVIDRHGLTKFYRDGNRHATADRESNSEYSAIGSLKNIIYPTGAVTSLEYEGNQEYGVVVGNRTQFLRNRWSSCNSELYANDIADPMALSQVELDNSEFIVTLDLNFDTNHESACSCPGRFGVIIEAYPTYDLDNGVPISMATGDAFQEFNPTCNQEYEFGPFSMAEFSPPLNPGIAYEYRIKPNPNPTFDNIGSATFVINYRPEENHEVGGIRVKKIISNGDYTLFNYKDNMDRSTGKVLVEPRYGFEFREVSTEFSLVGTMFSSTSLINTSDVYGQVFGYKSVVTTKDDDGTTDGDEVVSKYTYNLIKSYSSGYPINPVVPQYKNGTPHEVFHYRNGDPYDVVASKNFIGDVRYIGQQEAATNLKYKIVNCTSNPIGEGGDQIGVSIDAWVSNEYSLSPSGFYALYENIETRDNLTSSTSYSYGWTHTLPTAVTFSGPGAGRTTAYTFPEDLSGTPTADLLLSKHMITTPLETKIDGGAGGGSKTEFKLDGGYIVPYKFSRWNDDTHDWNLVSEHKNFKDGLPYTIEKVGFDGNRPIILQELLWSDRLLTSLRTDQRTQTFDYYFNGHRQLKSLTTIDRQTTKFIYDPLWRLQKEASRNGIITNEYSYFYGPSHGKNSVYKGVKIKDVGYALNTEQYYDGFGRPIAFDKKNYAASGATWTESQVYNAHGSVINKCDPAQGDCYDYTYYPSALQRIKSERQGNWPRPVTYTHGVESGLFSTERTSEDGVVTKTLTDGLGRTSVSIDGLGQSTSYSYDSRGSITSISGPAGSYTYAYDGLGRLESKSVPNGGTYEYTYYNNDLLKSMTDPKGQSTTNEYNDYGELIFVYNGLTASGEPISSYTYGSGQGDAGKLLSSDVYTSMGPRASSHSYVYDAFGRIKNEIVNTGYLRANYNHKEIDNADFVKVTTRDDIVYNMDYDHGGRQTSFSTTWNETPLSTSSEYNDNDWRILHDLGGLQKVNYGYNGRGWLTNINAIDKIVRRKRQTLIPEIYEDDLTELYFELKISYDKADLSNCTPTNVLLEVDATINIITGVNAGSYPISDSEIIPINGGDENMDSYPNSLDYKFYGALNVDDIMRAIKEDMVLENIIGSSSGTLCGGCSFEAILRPVHDKENAFVFELKVDGKNILNRSYDLRIDDSRGEFIADMDTWLRQNGGGRTVVEEISENDNDLTSQYRIRLMNVRTESSYDHILLAIPREDLPYRSLFMATSDSSEECVTIGDFNFSFPSEDPCSINRQLISIRIGGEVLRFDDNDQVLLFSDSDDRDIIYNKIYKYFKSNNLTFRRIKIRPNGIDILGAPVLIDEINIRCSDSGYGRK